MERLSAKYAGNLSENKFRKDVMASKEKHKYLCQLLYKERGETTFFRWLRDLLEIYTWKEVWLAFSFPTMIVGFWLLLSFLLGIESDNIRTIAIWSLISFLTLGAAGADYIRKRQKDGKT